jgi:MFS family permease
MFGNLGAAASPLIVAGISQAFGWNTALYVCSALFVFSGVCWLGMDGRVPIVPESAERGTSVPR